MEGAERKKKFWVEFKVSDIKGVSILELRGQE